MSANLNPRTVILQSNSNPDQYFYFFFIDVPSSDYPLTQVTPSWDGNKVITYTNMNYTFPDNPDPGTLQTQALEPLSITFPQGTAPTVEDVEYVASNGTKKGVVKGTKIASDWGKLLFEDTSSLDYVCKDRAFVIQSDTQSDTYFVGTLVDFPENEAPMPPLSTVEHLSLSIGTTTSSAKTHSMILYEPSTYDGTTTPKSASFKSIHVSGYGDPAQRGIFLNDTDIDLFANPLIPDTPASTD